MNLYLLTQDVNNGYDTYDSCVVAAPDEESARRIHPGHHEVWESDSYAVACWARPHNVAVSLIGTAKEGTSAGVVLASFNAG